MDTTQENKPIETPVTGTTDTKEATPAVEAPKVCTAGLDTPSATPAGVCTAGFDTPAVPFYKKYVTQLSILAAVVIILGAGGYVYVTHYVHDGIIATIKGKDIYLYPQGGVVATVNGTKIYRKELNESLKLVEQSATAQGADLTDPATLAKIRTQALDVLINNELITSAATKDGITASDDDVQKKYDELIAQFGTKEDLAAKMTEVGLSEETLRANLHDRILADRYVEAQTDIESLTVSDEEVAEFVKAVSANGGKMPPLKEIRPQIEAQLLQQKQQDMINGLIKKLHDAATIETKI